MSIQKITKYAQHFDLMIIHEEGMKLPFSDTAKQIFRKVVFKTLKQTSAEACNCHLLFVCASSEGLKSAPLKAALSTINALESVIVTPESNHDVSVFRTALSLRAANVIDIPQDEAKFSDEMLKIFPNLIKKHNESLLQGYHRYIAEHSDYLFSIQRGGKTLYANDTLKLHFGASNLSELDRYMSESEIGQVLATPGANQKVLSRMKTSQDTLSEYFINTHPLKDGETLLGMFPLNVPMQTSEKRLHSRMSFIELLKDAFIIHEDETIPVVIIHIENSDKIIKTSGQNIYNEICKEILVLAKSHFDQEAEIAQWHKDVYTIISSEMSLEHIKHTLERFHKDVFTRITIENAIPVLDSFVIDMQGVDLNKAIGIIDHIHQKQLLSTDIGTLVYHEVSATNQKLDDTEHALNYLEKLMFTKSPIKLLNFYKGIRISTPARIVKLSEGLAYIAIEKIQGYAMKLEEHTVIQATNIPYDLHADVKIVDVGKKITVLSKFHPLKASANNRQYIRIQSDHRMHVTMTSAKRVAAGTIMDISIKSIACKINASTPPPDIDTPVMLQFTLPMPKTDEGMVTMSVKGKIQYVQPTNEFTKVVIVLELHEPYESYMIEYIYNRQQSLINEIKTIANKL